MELSIFIHSSSSKSLSVKKPNSQHSKFVLLALNVITNNDNLTKVVID